jgi:hypothetical protein
VGEPRTLLNDKHMVDDGEYMDQQRKELKAGSITKAAFARTRMQLGCTGLSEFRKALPYISMSNFFRLPPAHLIHLGLGRALLRAFFAKLSSRGGGDGTEQDDGVPKARSRCPGTLLFRLLDQRLAQVKIPGEIGRAPQRLLPASRSKDSSVTSGWVSEDYQNFAECFADAANVRYE